MRKARFSGLNDRQGDPTAPLALPALVSFDFSTPEDSEMESVAAERARALAVAVPLLASCHLLWSVVLLQGLWSGGVALLGSPVPLVLAAILLLDLGLWLALNRPGSRPRRTMALAALHTLAVGGLWAGAATLVAGEPAGQAAAVRGALIAGAASSLPAFFTVPAFALLSCGGTLAASALAHVDESLLGIGTALGLVLIWLSVFRARDQVMSARRRLSLEADAEKAESFVADYEASGRGWFWETDAEGALTYASEPFAARLGRPRAALIGTRFEDVLSAGEAGNPLGFHLSARFPFAEVTVRAPGEEEVWWSLSGRPNFDAYGRFLGFRGLGVNLSEQQRSEAEASRLARFDSLTGLPNRATMRSMLDSALANAEDRRRGCALFTIDLDRFKQVNDTLGHPVGDKLLRKVAQRLTDVLGEHGEVGRLGGDEFEAILPGMDGEGRLAELAGALIAEISRPYSLDGHRVEIGASVGIAVARPGRAYADGLIKEADLALYAAKADGRGTFRFFEAKMHSLAAERQVLENDLREALGRSELRLLFQPMVDSVTEEVVAFEALLRWHHPSRGIIPPTVLIPLAEDCALMPRIGDWVLRTACAEAMKWPPHVRVSVNLSPSQIEDPALPATVTGTLAHCGLDPERLELEVGEQAFLADGGATNERLARLKRIGVRLALDNFGTGHSGLGQLRGAPLDKIKIDRSFVQGASAPGNRNAAIVRAIVVLAESFGMDTTAEGVETQDEVALVRRLGCSQVQGFLFGRPMSAEEALKLARESRATAEILGFSRPPRHRLIRMGVIRVGGDEIPVRLRNISEGGAMIECERSFQPAEKVTLDLEEAGAVEAEVRWCQRGQVGLRFNAPFRLSSLAPAAAPLRRGRQAG
jgi:diguanylate cyclase (GGDEF)-like protein